MSALTNLVSRVAGNATRRRRPAGGAPRRPARGGPRSAEGVIRKVLRRL